MEAIAIAWDLLAGLGAQALVLEINTLGNQADRAFYRERLVDFLEQHKQRLDPDSQERLERNPLRILDSKDSATQALLSDAPMLADSLAPASRDRFEQVQAGLARLGISFTLNARLVRGLDYYSHTAFEITSTQLGAQATVCGGGRYDGLVEQLGGPPTPAIGWVLGMERLVLLLSQTSGPASFFAGPDVYLVNRGDASRPVALALAPNLRYRGLSVELDASPAAFGKQFKPAHRSGAAWAVVLGDGVVEKGVVRLKSLRPEGVEYEIHIGDLERLVAMLKGREVV